MHWPQFLFVEGPQSFVWGGTREIYRIESTATGPILQGPEWPELARDLGTLIAASRTPKGTLVVCDSAGHVKGLRREAAVSWSFATRLRDHPGGLAATDQSVYLLLQGAIEGGAAVVAYDFSGAELGRWGEQPTSALIQPRLNGGGIAACPDGSVFYSYINSPDLFHLEVGRQGEASVRTLRREDRTFQVLSARSILRAYRESKRSHSVKQLVKLGLSASRVLGLVCSQEGLLFRQVAQPKGGGSYVEVWSPPTGELLGTLPVTGVLLDALDDTLYLGMLRDDRFHLERLRFRIVPPDVPRSR